MGVPKSLLVTLGRLLAAASWRRWLTAGALALLVAIPCIVAPIVVTQQNKDAANSQSLNGADPSSAVGSDGTGGGDQGVPRGIAVDGSDLDTTAVDASDTLKNPLAGRKNATRTGKAGVAEWESEVISPYIGIENGVVRFLGWAGRGNPAARLAAGAACAAWAHMEQHTCCFGWQAGLQCVMRMLLHPLPLGHCSPSSNPHTSALLAPAPQFDHECRPYYPTGFNAFELTTLAACELHASSSCLGQPTNRLPAGPAHLLLLPQPAGPIAG